MNAFHDYREKEDIQENAFNALAWWVEVCNLAQSEKDPDRLLAGLKSIYVYVHMRIPKEEAAHIRMKLKEFENILYTTREDGGPEPLVRTRVLDGLYDILLDCSKVLHEKNILYRVVVPPGEMSLHGTI